MVGCASFPRSYAATLAHADSPPANTSAKAQFVTLRIRLPGDMSPRFVRTGVIVPSEGISCLDSFNGLFLRKDFSTSRVLGCFDASSDKAAGNRSEDEQALVVQKNELALHLRDSLEGANL